MNINNMPFQRFRTKIDLFGLSLAVVLATGCASSGKSTANKSISPDFEMPPPGKVKIIFIRPDSNGGIDVGVHDGEQLVAKLPGKTYGVYQCEPGQHLFSGSFGNLDILNANLSPDRIYYIKAGLVLKAFGPAWVKLSPLYPGGTAIDWQKVPRILGEVNKNIVTPEQAAHDRTGIDRYMERLKVYQNKPGAVFESVLPEYGQTTPLLPQ